MPDWWTVNQPPPREPSVAQKVWLQFFGPKPSESIPIPEGADPMTALQKAHHIGAAPVAVQGAMPASKAFVEALEALPGADPLMIKRHLMKYGQDQLAMTAREAWTRLAGKKEQ